MVLKEFIFVVRTPKGEEYEMTVPALHESDAERRLKNLLDTLSSDDKIVSSVGFGNRALKRETE